MNDVRKQINDYNQAVRKNSFLCLREACPYCLFLHRLPGTTVP